MKKKQASLYGRRVRRLGLMRKIPSASEKEGLDFRELRETEKQRVIRAKEGGLADYSLEGEIDQGERGREKITTR